MSDGRSRRLRLLSWILLAAALAIIVGGLVYDGTREGEEPDLSSLYAVGCVLALLAMAVGYRGRSASGRDSGRRDRRA